MVFPTNQGTYILLLRLALPVSLTIGRLGSFDFPAGWYAYVGSAFGAGGLSGRLKHHLAPVTKPHWHVDYLRAAAPVREVWYVASAATYEHRWAAVLLALPDATLPVPRFGASDCRCPAHLVFFPKKPELNAFSRAAGIPVAHWLPPNSTLIPG